MDWESLRREMVDTQLVPRGITDERVLDAMREMPRTSSSGRGWRRGPTETTHCR